MPTRDLGKIFSDGQIIFRQGETADCLYTILSGNVLIYQEIDGKEVNIAELREGDFFGEMGFVKDNLRTTSARSMGEARVLSVGYPFVLRKFKDDPSYAFRLLELMARQIKKRDEELSKVGRATRSRGVDERRRWHFFRRIHPFVEGFPAFVLLQTLNGQAYFVNRYFREHFGEPGEQPLRKFLPAMEEIVAGWERASSDSDHIPRNWEGELPGGRFSRVFALPFVEDGGTRLALIFGVDITESRQMEKAFETRSDRLNAVTELVVRTLSEPDLPSLMNEVVLTSATLLDVELCGVLERQTDRPALIVRASVGFPSGGEVGTDATSQMGYTLLASDPVIVDDLRLETRFTPAPHCLDHGAVSGLNVIIGGSNERSSGVLTVFSRKRRVFSVDDVQFLKSMANIVGMAILKARLEGQLDRYHRHLEELVAERTSELSAVNQSLQYSLSREQASRAEAEKGKQILESLMDSVPEGIAIAGSPELTIKMVSRVGLEMVGSSPEILLGCPAGEQAQQWGIYASDGETPAGESELPLYRAARKGEVIRDQELIFRKQDGTRVTILASAGPIRDGDGKVTGGVIAWRDITPRKRTEAKLAYLASFPERNPNPIIEVDPSGEILYVNPAVDRLFPTLREAGLSHPWLSGLEQEIHSLRRGESQYSSSFRDFEGRRYHQTILFVEDNKCIRIYGAEIAEHERIERAG